MFGGSKGLLQNSTNLCAAKNRAISEFTGHNGKRSDSRPVLVALGCHRHAKRHSRHRRSRAPRRARAVR